VRRTVHLIRQARGRKVLDDPKGKCVDLDEVFEDLNARFFGGLMARPRLGWSRRRSRTRLGHFDPSHNVIVLSKILDDAGLPRLAVEYVMFHEMLHLVHGEEIRRGRRKIHTADFREAEGRFPEIQEAKRLLRNLT
jgi:predicted SprT family Zn-dependent metalloprotease